MFGGATGLLSGIFQSRNARLDRDRDQHHLASMLISIAAGRTEITRDDIRNHLRDRRYSRAEIVVRLSHAVKLAGTAVSGEMHARVLALARDLG